MTMVVMLNSMKITIRWLNSVSKMLKLQMGLQPTLIMDLIRDLLTCFSSLESDK